MRAYIKDGKVYEEFENENETLENLRKRLETLERSIADILRYY